uniref:TTF-type domain-containing protein n=1 Tax=Amphimedon queenslandica TaxID=400682 RepID=A0A1X7TKE6_AMPQE
MSKRKSTTSITSFFSKRNRLGLPDDRELIRDIGQLLETHRNIHTSNISRDYIFRILKREPDFNPLPYPRTRQSTGCNRHFQPTWMKKFPWLDYSHHVDGVFCRACVFFAPDEVCRQSHRQFVTAPFKA